MFVMAFCIKQARINDLESFATWALKLEWITAEEFKNPINTFFDIINPLSSFLENLRLSILRRVPWYI